MIYYDSNPRKGVLGYFVGDAITVCGSIHDNFEFAKAAARAQLAKQMAELDEMRMQDCPKIGNPFGG